MNNDDSPIIRSIVLIDDDPDFLHVMRRRLESQRREYAPAGPVEIFSFTDPVDAVVNLPPDGLFVTFIDYSMPDGTGLDWLPKLIKAGAGPIILLTNQNEANVAAEAFREGAADYLAKGDIMDDKRLVRTIREAVHRHRLEVRNRLLTKQLKLVNNELETKNKKLAELTDTAHQFVDDVAHDFRTPLTVIQQYASIIAEGLGGSVTQKQSAHLSVIADATHELAEMVDDFLDSSKLRARALPVDRQRHTVQELFDSVEPMLAVRGKNLKVERTIADGIFPFFGDLSKAARVLSNLAGNAIKATPPDKPLRLWALPAESGDLRIGVTDEGRGMSSEDLKVIFDRFKQLGEFQVENIKGFGLGLAIVKQLIHLNLGTIEVQSEPGKGSTFSFTLPAYDLVRIVACYLEHVRSCNDPGDLCMLRILSSDSKGDTGALRRLITTFSYPMDLVLQDNEGVMALGISKNVEGWCKRLRGEVTRFQESSGQKNPWQLDLRVASVWPKDTDGLKLHSAIVQSLVAGGYHAT
jgi:signal transduction histidine kinase